MLDRAYIASLRQVWKTLLTQCELEDYPANKISRRKFRIKQDFGGGEVIIQT